MSPCLYHLTMSSVHRSVGKQPAGVISNETPASNSSQELDKETAMDATFETPTSNTQETEKYTIANGTSESARHRYPRPLALFFLIVAICTSVFLVSLDRTIITTVSERQYPPPALALLNRLLILPGNPAHYRSIPLLQRRRLVRECIPHHGLFLFANIWTHLRHAGCEEDLP